LVATAHDDRNPVGREIPSLGEMCPEALLVLLR
jgi:hypothetical protein